MDDDHAIERHRRRRIEELRRESPGRSSKADRDPVVVAHWEGDSRSRIEMDGGKSLYVGGDNQFSAMAGLLGMLAASDVEAVSTHAALIGLEIADLRSKQEVTSTLRHF